MDIEKMNPYLRVAQEVVREIERARAKHPNTMRSGHEGYAILLEEVQEAWDEIKADRLRLAKREMVQVAAMAISFIVEVPE